MSKFARRSSVYRCASSVSGQRPRLAASTAHSTNTMPVSAAPEVRFFRSAATQIPWMHITKKHQIAVCSTFTTASAWRPCVLCLVVALHRHTSEYPCTVQFPSVLGSTPHLQPSCVILRHVWEPLQLRSPSAVLLARLCFQRPTSEMRELPAINGIIELEAAWLCFPSGKVTLYATSLVTSIFRENAWRCLDERVGNDPQFHANQNPMALADLP
jgi:hypothetical protein